MVGTTISHYKVLEKIGQGGMGEVFLAQDTTLDRKVALKFLPEELQKDSTARKRFLREAKSAAALDHPFICKIYEVGEEEEKSFISMEYIRGMTLQEKLGEGPLPLRNVLRTAGEIAEALEEAHKQGIVHRDLKPSNIMLTPQGHVKVMDFGLAKRVTPVEGQEQEITTALTKQGSTLGTVPYMPPEQVRGQVVDTRSDIFSFGVVLYEMLTGVNPFKKDTSVDTSHAILGETPPPLTRYTEDIPVLLQHTVRKMLAKAPDDRYQLIHDVRTDLRQLLTSTPQPPGGEAGVERGRKGLWRAAAMLGSLLLLWAGWWFFSEEATVIRTGQITSIAVLPLDNLTGDPEQEYFVDGMSDALITNLSKIGTLKVISRTSAMRYKGSDKSIPDIARELGVDAVIEGSVLRAGERVRITAQLIHGTTDEHLWAESYERELSEILALQSEVAQAIAQEIRIVVTAQEQALLASTHPVNPEAYEAYLKGRFHLNRATPAGMDTALEYFQLALEKDPNYAPAHGFIADTWGVRTYLGLVSPREAFPKSKAGVLKALELDDKLAEAHDLLGRLRFYYEWDWGGAEPAFQRAIELNPNYAAVRSIYADFLVSMGRAEEATAEMERCLELDPFNSSLVGFVGQDLLYLNRYDDAIAQLRKALRIEPNSPMAHLGLWGVFHQKLMHEEALAEAKKYFAVLGNTEAEEALARGYAEAGYSRAMSLAAEKLVARAKLGYVQPTQIARLYAHAEEKDQALDWLKRAYEERDMALVHLSVDLDWDSLRSDPRFTDLLRRMNLMP